MKGVERDHDGEASDEFGDEAVLHEVVAVDAAAYFVGGALAPFVGYDVGLESDALAVFERALFDYLVHPLERAAAHEQDVVGAYLQEFLMRMLAPALRGDVGDAALDYLEQRLLNALAGHVPRYRAVGAFARDLVYFVYVDDAALSPRYVEVRRLYQAQQDVLDVLAHVARLRERGGVGDGERDFEYVGEVLRQMRLAGAGGAYHQDVRLLQLDPVVLAPLGRPDALVVVVDGDAQHLLGLFLPDHVLRELGVDALGVQVQLFGVGGALGGAPSPLLGRRRRFFRDYLVAEVDAFVADENLVGPRYEPLDLRLRFAAKGAVVVRPSASGRSAASSQCPPPSRVMSGFVG